MKPDEPSSRQSGMPLSPQRLTVSVPNQQSNQQAAANVIRAQIDTLLTAQTTVAQLDDINPYQRTHAEHSDPQVDQWKEYHSAWQNYYQKYYEGYYTHHLKNAQQAIQEQNNLNPPKTDNTPSTEETIFDLHQKLVEKVKQSATKIRKSRHFIPIAAGLIVILIFLFLQYNRVIISNVVAYISPGNIDPQNIVINPSSNVIVGPEARLIIPKINVDVPVIYDVGNDYDSQMTTMAKGVAHFAIPGANSHPGQVGNTVIAGHSSNDLLDTGDYKFIFAQLDKLDVGDTIYANYHSIRYTYAVTKKEIVKPTDTNKLVYPTTIPVLTLLTCTPLGTAISRLLVTANQISPDPSQSTSAPTVSSQQSKSIPGNSPTLFERIFGGGGN